MWPYTDDENDFVSKVKVDKPENVGGYDREVML